MFSKQKNQSSREEVVYPRPKGAVAKTAWPTNSRVQFWPNGHVSGVNCSGFLKSHNHIRQLRMICVHKSARPKRGIVSRWLEAMCNSIGCLEMTRDHPCLTALAERGHFIVMTWIWEKGGQQCSISSLLRGCISNTASENICQELICLKIFTQPITELNIAIFLRYIYIR